MQVWDICAQAQAVTAAPRQLGGDAPSEEGGGTQGLAGSIAGAAVPSLFNSYRRSIVLQQHLPN